MHEKYGDTGSAAYKRWESKYKQIQKEVKFGNKAQDNAFLELKKEISADADRYINDRKKMTKFAWISLLAPLAGLMLVSGIASMFGDWIAIIVLIITIIMPIYGFSSIKDCRKALIAAIDFDEQYFGGEIFFKKKNGMSL